MKPIDLIRLIRLHIVILILVPLLLAGVVAFLTRKPVYLFSSETTIYTGIASGGSVDMDKGFNFFATNTAFDNLINVVKARETQVDVGIHLLAQHLMMTKHDTKFLSYKSFNDLQRITPGYIKKLVVRHATEPKRNAGQDPKELTIISGEDTVSADSFSFSSLDSSGTSAFLPVGTDPLAFEQTVANLTAMMEADDTNFVYQLLNFTNPHYSIRAISKISVQRISSSDLVKLKYTTDDPGICQQTLIFMTRSCIRNYRKIKENRSDAVVKYFEHQVKQASEKLKLGEDKLLKFNESNNIINYYEQSKAIAVMKEELDLAYHNKRINLAGTEAAIRRIEEKLGNQKKIQLQSDEIILKRNNLAEISARISTIETIGLADSINTGELVTLKATAERLKDELRTSVNSYFTYNNTVEGLPLSTLLNDWISNVIEYEDTKAGLAVLADRIKDFQRQYAIYAPAGANLKRIEREISVSEQEFLELLHGLNLAKLKMQDVELSSNLKAVDPPYFPLSPNPTKRKMLVMIAAVFGFILLLSVILLLEYLDNTLRNPGRAQRYTGLVTAGLFPKILLKSGRVNFRFIANRLLEMIIQHIELRPANPQSSSTTRTILFFSTLSNEGKSVLVNNLAGKLNKQGKSVFLFSFSRESLQKNEVLQLGYPTDPPGVSRSGSNRKKTRYPIFSTLLGYPDTRIDYTSPFLAPVTDFVQPENFCRYEVNESFFKVQDVTELAERNGSQIQGNPDFIFVELPPILYYSFPNSLVSGADEALLVCRANRTWTTADKLALETFKKIHDKEMYLLLNGVDFQTVSSVLGDLPADSSWINRLLKKILRFQVHNRHQI
jgi:uncharacterized protein involved in exopolysaccharide biosynthesis